MFCLKLRIRFKSPINNLKIERVDPEKDLALAKLIGDSGVAFTPVIVNPISCHVVSMKATNNPISFYTTKKVS